MAKDYVANNEGQGFAAFDDDEQSDLDSLLAGAARGSDQEEEDDSTDLFAGIQPKNDPDYEAPKPKPAPPAPAEYSFNENQYSDPSFGMEAQPTAEVSNDYTYTAPPAVEEPVYAPEPTVMPTYQEPTPVEDNGLRSSGRRAFDPSMDPSFGSAFGDQSMVSVAPSTPTPVTVPEPRPARIQMRSEADELSIVSKAIRILEVYRPLTDEVKAVASQLITNGEELLNEAQFVVKVLNVDPDLNNTMRAFVEAKSLDPVERAFYVIGLDQHSMHNLGALIDAFSGNTTDKSLSNIFYAKSIVHEIDKLDSRAVSFVEATEAILSAAREESN